ncbi:HNH endonuclease [Providencia rettgeri]|uniref:HNH endonuclease n=2 Tax=Morganellaceae TaxID=1903414 RepID=UPI0014088E74|nr:HNH endonuclease [Providencia rettgeri]ELR5186592.1 HNH endonuclease [Providencia rettgeri]EMB0751151.1 HNH endonuclease [Providencia rettgeri]HEC8322430.1 HNH endonuclease [Providencia rettgeri]
MARFTYTKQMCNWMYANYMLRLDELTKRFNQEFNTERTREAINGFRKRLGLNVGRSGKFSKGNTPYNKGTKGLVKPNSGSFKRGRKPHNRQLVGTEALTQDGYVKVKIAEPSKWELKHRLIWEQHNGPIPCGHVIKFIDDNKQNCDIANLMIISIKEHAIINRYFSGASAEHKPTVLQLARIKIAIHDRTKRQDQC